MVTGVSINLGRVGSPVTSVTMLVISSTWVAHINFMYGEYPSDKSKNYNWEYTKGSAFDLVHDLVDINTAGIGKLAVVTVPTGVQQHPVVLINFAIIISTAADISFTTLSSLG